MLLDRSVLAEAAGLPRPQGPGPVLSHSRKQVNDRTSRTNHFPAARHSSTYAECGVSARRKRRVSVNNRLTVQWVTAGCSLAGFGRRRATAKTVSTARTDKDPDCAAEDDHHSHDRGRRNDEHQLSRIVSWTCAPRLSITGRRRQGSVAVRPRPCRSARRNSAVLGQRPTSTRRRSIPPRCTWQ